MTREEDEYWRLKVVAATRDQLGTVQKAATGWSTLFTAVLGVFGTVTFAGGLPDLDTLPEGARTPLRLLALAAVGLVLAATVMAGRAANTFPKLSNNQTGEALKKETKVAALAALTRLQKALKLGVAAAAIVLLSSLVVVVAGIVGSPPGPVSAMAVVDGRAVCGILQGDEAGLKIGDVVLTGVTSVEVVDRCPS